MWRELRRRLEGYQRLKEFIDGFDRGSRVQPVRVFYLATPPDLYGPVIQQIAAVGLAPRETDGEPRTRVIIEKPFGTDLANRPGAQPQSARSAR